MTIDATWGEDRARLKLGEAVRKITFQLFQETRYGRALKEHLDAAIDALGKSTREFVVEEFQRRASAESGADTLARMAAINQCRHPLEELAAESDRIVREILRDAIEDAVRENRADLQHIKYMRLDSREESQVKMVFYKVLSTQLAVTEKRISNMLEQNAESTMAVMQRLENDLLHQDLRQ